MGAYLLRIPKIFMGITVGFYSEEEIFIDGWRDHSYLWEITDVEGDGVQEAIEK